MMTVRTPAKKIKELNADASEEMEHEESSDAAEDSENDEEMDSNDGDVSDEADNDSEGNAGWADAFAKVLQQEKPKNKKYLVLSKAKKLSDQTENDSDKKPTFEIARKDDESADEDIKPDIKFEDEKPTQNELDLALNERKERNNKLLQLRVKPSAMDRERERSFKRIATKGVVQLFNAVRSQQRDLVDRLEKAGPLDHKRDEVLNNINKRQFLDMLMGGKRAKSEAVDNPVKDEKDANGDDDTQPSQWSVLRDDFMTSKKIKHWDKDDDERSDDQAANYNDTDSNSD